MASLSRSLIGATSALAIVLAACAPAAPASPTAAPAKPAEKAAPTAAPAKPAATTAPAKPAEKPAAKATEKPAAKAETKAETKPAAKTEAKPAAKTETKPAAKPGANLTLTDAEKSEVEGFYRGKTVRILVGFAAGGGYDVFARVTGRHLSKFLPGNPNVIVENMTGAASLTAANHTYNVAPKDGTVIATFSPGLVLEQALGGGGGAHQFDPSKFPWLGSPTVSTNQCMVRTDTGVDSMDKLIATDKEIVFGSTAPGSMATSAAPTLIGHYLNPKVRVVQGYDGVATIKAAVERGELDGQCGTWETFRSTHAEWLQGNPPFAKVIVKAKEDPKGELKDVPLLSQYLPNEEAKQIHQIAAAPDAAGFVYAAPPDMPPARLKALRAALFQTWNDPAFKEDADKAKLAPIPQDYAMIEQLFAQIVSAPPATLQRAKEVLGIQ